MISETYTICKVIYIYHCVIVYKIIFSCSWGPQVFFFVYNVFINIKTLYKTLKCTTKIIWKIHGVLMYIKLGAISKYISIIEYNNRFYIPEDSYLFINKVFNNIKLLYILLKCTTKIIWKIHEILRYINMCI